MVLVVLLNNLRLLSYFCSEILSFSEVSEYWHLFIWFWFLYGYLYSDIFYIFFFNILLICYFIIIIVIIIIIHHYHHQSSLGSTRRPQKGFPKKGGRPTCVNNKYIALFKSLWGGIYTGDTFNIYNIYLYIYNIYIYIRAYISHPPAWPATLLYWGGMGG